jgi:Domain of unknown function (DUF4276)
LAVASPGWKFYKFGLIVTGEGEEEFLPKLFRPLQSTGNCQFMVIRRIGQRSPVTSPKKKLKMVGSGKTIPTKDEEEIGLPARRWLDGGGDFVILVDDLEGDRAKFRRDVFSRYKTALEVILVGKSHLASVHFLVNMIEAYYFADAKAINSVLGTTLTDHAGDVEEIHHPKNELKKISPQGFDEKSDGKQIMERLDVEHVLSNLRACASLRVLFAWCEKMLGLPVSARFGLDAGVYDVVTGSQLA